MTDDVLTASFERWSVNDVRWTVKQLRDGHPGAFDLKEAADMLDVFVRLLQPLSDEAVKRYAENHLMKSADAS